MDLAPDFDEFCALLTAREVKFVIVGTHALAFHGAPRFTGDLDILVRPTEENGRRVLAAISEFGFPTTRLTAADIVGGTKPGGTAGPALKAPPRRTVKWRP